MDKKNIKIENFFSDGILENTTILPSEVENIEIDEKEQGNISIINETYKDSENTRERKMEEKEKTEEVEIKKESEVDLLDLNKDKKLDSLNLEEENYTIREIQKKKKIKKEKENDREREIER